MNWAAMVQRRRAKAEAERAATAARLKSTAVAAAKKKADAETAKKAVADAKIADAKKKAREAKPKGLQQRTPKRIKSKVVGRAQRYFKVRKAKAGIESVKEKRLFEKWFFIGDRKFSKQDYKQVETPTGFIIQGPDVKYLKERERIKGPDNKTWDTYTGHKLVFDKEGRLLKEISKATYKTSDDESYIKRSPYAQEVTTYTDYGKTIDMYRDVDDRVEHYKKDYYIGDEYAGREWGPYQEELAIARSKEKITRQKVKGITDFDKYKGQSFYEKFNIEQKAAFDIAQLKKGKSIDIGRVQQIQSQVPKFSGIVKRRAYDLGITPYILPTSTKKNSIGRFIEKGGSLPGDPSFKKSEVEKIANIKNITKPIISQQMPNINNNVFNNTQIKNDFSFMGNFKMKEFGTKNVTPDNINKLKKINIKEKIY